MAARQVGQTSSSCIARLALAIAALAVGSSVAHGIVIYNESMSGDFSNTGTTPTVVTGLVSGENEVHGSTGNSGSGGDRDYFTFAVPVGLEWASLTALPGMAPGRIAFIALQAGSLVTLPANTLTAAGLLGWHHYNSDDVGNDLLPLMATPANGSSGFSAPLGAGNYAIWIQDSSPGQTLYGLNFQLRHVPDSGPGLGVLATLLALAFLRRRAFVQECQKKGPCVTG